MASSVKDTAAFFINGNSKQFEYCYRLYPQVLKLKAERRNKKPDELIRLDEWYQNELPILIKQRGKDAHMVHEELVQTMKWKQSRGKFYPQLSYLVKVNTPRAVIQETKKAFKKLPNLEQAITALSNLKGVGTTMASALLAAAAPDRAPFMADECLMAIPDIEGIDYTTKEYLNFVQHIDNAVERLNTEKDNTVAWSPHRVELALWTHYVASDLNPELLDTMPGVVPSSSSSSSSKVSISNGVTSTTDIDGVDNDVTDSSASNDSTSQNPGADNINDDAAITTSGTIQSSSASSDDTTPNTIEPSDESSSELAAPSNGNGNDAMDSLDESTRSEDSQEKPVTPIVITDETNDSDSLSSAKRSIDCDSSENSQPEVKKFRRD